MNNKVYHYTTIKAFQGIIKNNELWLLERNCMNDAFDENYIKSIEKKILNQNNDPLYKYNFYCLLIRKLLLVVLSKIVVQPCFIYIYRNTKGSNIGIYK